MRKTRLLQALALASLLAVGGVSAQTFSLNWNPRSGDVWVDTQLSDINRYGMQYRDPFIDEMVRYHGAPRDLVTDLLVTRRWAPGDVYYACTLASIIGRPCGYVADYWEKNHGQGWGVVAKQMGIKPGSAEFHRLKQGFVPSYDRWGRTIVLDDDLKRAYPNRGKPAHAGKPNNGKGSHGNKGNSGKAHAGKAKPAKANNGNRGNRGNNGKGNGNGNGKGKGGG